MDREAWWATVLWVSKSQPWLKWLSTHTHVSTAPDILCSRNSWWLWHWQIFQTEPLLTKIAVQTIIFSLQKNKSSAISPCFSSCPLYSLLSLAVTFFKVYTWSNSLCFKFSSRFPSHLQWSPVCTMVEEMLRNLPCHHHYLTGNHLPAGNTLTHVPILGTFTSCFPLPETFFSLDMCKLNSLVSPRTHFM